jgi:hypothetical protein
LPISLPKPRVSHGHTRYAPVGRCIYCPNTTGPFTDEHIVPEGLGGTWILEEASCPKCQEETCSFEGVVQGHMMKNYRICVGLSTSNKRKETVRVVFLDKDGKETETDLLKSDAPFGLSLPVFHPADFFERASSARSHLRGSWSVMMNWDFEHQSKTHGRFGFQIADLKPNHFARMIAKIAHSYAVAEFGLGAFPPLLTGIVRAGEDYRSFIGSDLMEESRPTREGFHVVGHSWTLRDGFAWPIINIQLFAQYRAPVYHAMVGPIPLSAIRPM